MKQGRPLKFKTADELQKKIDAYFKDADEKKEPYRVIAMAHSLGITRASLREYEGLVLGHKKGKDDERRRSFASIIKKAKERCADWLEWKALINQINPVVAIFLLKANHKYKDKEDPDVIVHNNNIQNRDPEKEKLVDKLLKREGLQK